MSKTKIIIAVVSVSIVVMIVWQMMQTMTAAEPLTKEEASQLVKEMYNGEIVEIKKENQLYKISIELETGTYLVNIDQITGNVTNLERIKQVETPTEKDDTKPTDVAKEDPSTPEKEQKEEKPKPTEDKPNPPEQTTKKITESEAIQIALKKVKGNVDDVEIGQSGGKTYYLIEIETEKEDATVQVNAITGEIMNIIWDD